MFLTPATDHCGPIFEAMNWWRSHLSIIRDKNRTGLPKFQAMAFATSCQLLQKTIHPPTRSWQQQPPTKQQQSTTTEGAHVLTETGEDEELDPDLMNGSLSGFWSFCGLIFAATVCGRRGGVWEKHQEPDEVDFCHKTTSKVTQKRL